MSIYVFFLCVAVWKSRDGRVLVYMCKFCPYYSPNCLICWCFSRHIPTQKKIKRTQVAKSLHLDTTMVANYMTTLKNSSQFLNHKIIMAPLAKLYTPHSLRLKMVVKVLMLYKWCSLRFQGVKGTKGFYLELNGPK